MQTLNSSLTGKRGTFSDLRDVLDVNGFTLANWDYEYGYFDRQLDDKGMVFLRLPVEVLYGKLDNEDALIQFGTPFVLKHIYQTGVEENIGYYTGAAPLVNQFQEPVEKDAPVEAEWVRKGEEVLRGLEQKF